MVQSACSKCINTIKDRLMCEIPPDAVIVCGVLQGLVENLVAPNSPQTGLYNHKP